MEALMSNQAQFNKVLAYVILSPFLFPALKAAGKSNHSAAETKKAVVADVMESMSALVARGILPAAAPADLARPCAELYDVAVARLSRHNNNNVDSENVAELGHASHESGKKKR